MLLLLIFSTLVACTFVYRVVVAVVEAILPRR